MISNFWVRETLLVIALLFCMGFLNDAQAESTNEVLFSGSGFEIDTKYLGSLSSFYEAGGITTTEDQYLKQAIKIKMFSQEAKSIELDPQTVNVDHWDYDSTDPVNLMLIEDIGLAEAYMVHVKNTYDVDDILIESYYRSNPQFFRKDPWEDSDIMPLDDNIRQAIMSRMLDEVKNRIAEDVYNELKNKYEIQTN